MKVALFGSGKTGQFVEKLFPQFFSPSLSQDELVVFNSEKRPTKESLKGIDYGISFLTGDVFCEYIPLFIDSQINIVTGSTGVDYPTDLNERLEKSQLTWIWAHNFSLSMTVIERVLRELQNIESFFSQEQSDYQIEEYHHIHKKDAPSGTALRWQEWFGKEKKLEKIQSLREGDIIGYHSLEIKTPSEVIQLSHKATSRDLFAYGALWSLRYLITHKQNLQNGLLSFSRIVDQYFNQLYSHDLAFQVGVQGEEPRRASSTSQALKPLNNDPEKLKQKSIENQKK